jgi:hypothetical protein
MRRLIVLALILLVCCLQSVMGQTPSTNKQSLTNDDVIDLLAAGLSPEIVTAKIRSSPCKFDTSPAALKRLRAAHVADSVILAMVQALPPEEASLKTARVKCATNATEVSVWIAPGKLTEVASPKCGEKVDVLDSDKIWAKVRTQGGKVGYLSQQAIEDSVGLAISVPPAPAPPQMAKQPAEPSTVTSRVRSACSPAIESAISGEFEGWSGETIFKLDNGQIWEQAEYDYEYEYDYRPDVTIYETRAGCKMKVEGVDETILVRRIR